MPNHIINELIFRGVDDAAAAAIMAATSNAKGLVDFEVLLPVPLNMWWGNVGEEHERAFRRTRMDWAIESWGCKWNAYDHLPMEWVGDTLTLRFQTANRAPYPWLAAVFNKLRLTFEHNSLDEGRDRGLHGIFDVGQADTMIGPTWKEEAADDDLQRHLHKLLWGVEQFDDEEAE